MNLRLDISLGGTDSFDGMEGTYRAEGLSIANDHTRFQGRDIDLEVKHSDLLIGHRIGSGACSAVHIATHRFSGKIYAVKMFNVYDKAQSSQLLKEIALLTSLDCDALISLKGAFHNDGVVGMVLEYMDMGSLELLQDKFLKIDERPFAAIIFQIIWGLGYLHCENRLHRDIKPANALINSAGWVKLSDFGIAKELENSKELSNTAVGTFKYMSPERLLGEQYDMLGDVWSLGVLMLELYSKVHPFHDCIGSPIDLITELDAFDVDQLLASYDISKEMSDVVRSTLQYHSADRTACTELVMAPWFTLFGITSLDSAHEIVFEWIKTIDNRGSLARVDDEGSAEFREGTGRKKKNCGWRPALSPPARGNFEEEYSQSGGSSPSPPTRSRSNGEDRMPDVKYDCQSDEDSVGNTSATASKARVMEMAADEKTSAIVSSGGSERSDSIRRGSGVRFAVDGKDGDFNRGGGARQASPLRRRTDHSRKNALGSVVGGDCKDTDEDDPQYDDDFETENDSLRPSARSLAAVMHSRK